MQYENHALACQSQMDPAHEAEAPNNFLDLLLPPYCLLCGLPSSRTCICPVCLAELPWAGHYCRQCGLPLVVESDSLCGQCLGHAPPFAYTVYPLQYLFPVDRLVQSFKFNRQLTAGRILARLLCEHVTHHKTAYPEALIPMPLHPLRLFQRGYNQSYELAAYVSRVLGIPLLAGSLQRKRNTRAQSGLSGQQRRRNMRGAFSWRGWYPPPRHVVLVDDVMTTGTTVAECARVLKKAGSKRVDVWVAARAMPASHR